MATSALPSALLERVWSAHPVRGSTARTSPRSSPAPTASSQRRPSTFAQQETLGVDLLDLQHQIITGELFAFVALSLYQIAWYWQFFLVVVSWVSKKAYPMIHAAYIVFVLSALMWKGESLCHELFRGIKVDSAAHINILWFFLVHCLRVSHATLTLCCWVIGIIGLIWTGSFRYVANCTSGPDTICLGKQVALHLRYNYNEEWFKQTFAKASIISHVNLCHSGV